LCIILAQPWFPKHHPGPSLFPPEQALTEPGHRPSQGQAPEPSAYREHARSCQKRCPARFLPSLAPVPHPADVHNLTSPSPTAQTSADSRPLVVASSPPIHWPQPRCTPAQQPIKLAPPPTPLPSHHSPIPPQDTQRVPKHISGCCSPEMDAPAWSPRGDGCRTHSRPGPVSPPSPLLDMHPFLSY
jgi:hypothetical protein